MNLFSVWPNNCWRELYPSVIYRFVPSWGRRQTAIHTKVPAALSLLATPTWAHLCTQLPLVPCNQSSIYSSFPAWLCLPDWSLPCEIFWHSPTWLTVTGLCCPWFSCRWSPLSVPGWDFSLRPPGPWRLIAWLLFLPSTSCLIVCACCCCSGTEPQPALTKLSAKMNGTISCWTISSLCLQL